MPKTIKVRYEKGVFRPLEPVNLKEGEEVKVIVEKGGSIAEKFYGIAKKRRAEITKRDFLRVIEEIENEDIRGL